MNADRYVDYIDDNDLVSLMNRYILNKVHNSSFEDLATIIIANVTRVDMWILNTQRA